jgi:hypothetical protein
MPVGADATHPASTDLINLASSFSGVPLSDSSTATKTVASTVTNATAISKAAASLSGSATDSWTQTWTLDPVTDADDLRRLRALYRFATDDSYGVRYLLSDYPVQTKSTATNPSNPNSATKTSTDKSFMQYPSCVRCTPDSFPAEVKAAITRAVCKPGTNICIDPTTGASFACKTDKTECINPRLQKGWLVWDQSPPSPDYDYAAAQGGHQVFAKTAALSEFTLLVLSATAQSSSSTPNTTKQPKQFNILVR